MIDLCDGSVASDILRHSEQSITMQTDLRMSVREEMQSDQLDEDRAATRGCYYGARVYTLLASESITKVLRPWNRQ